MASGCVRRHSSTGARAWRQPWRPDATRRRAEQALEQRGDLEHARRAPSRARRGGAGRRRPAHATTRRPPCAGTPRPSLGAARVRWLSRKYGACRSPLVPSAGSPRHLAADVAPRPSRDDRDDRQPSALTARRHHACSPLVPLGPIRRHPSLARGRRLAGGSGGGGGGGVDLRPAVRGHLRCPGRGLGEGGRPPRAGGVRPCRGHGQGRAHTAGPGRHVPRLACRPRRAGRGGRGAQPAVRRRGGG